MRVNWIHLGNYLVGTVVGKGTVYVYNKITKKWSVYVCTNMQGGVAKWSAGCPQQVKERYAIRCP
jgi:hypothetical protein